MSELYVVTGASGQMGRLVIEELKQRVPAERIVAGARTPEEAADLGVEVRELDYDRPETVRAALDGARRVLLVSASEPGKRFPQHRVVIDAAAETGAAVVYTSAPKADSTHALLAAEHRDTEVHLRRSGTAYTILRNNWYHENFESSIRSAASSGAVFSATRGGRIASAARADYAAAAAAVLDEEGHEGKVYELAGDHAWTFTDLAAEIERACGQEIACTDLTPAQLRASLESAGLPGPVAEVFTDVDVQIGGGWLADTDHTLSRLIGRPTTPLRDYVRSVLS